MSGAVLKPRAALEARVDLSSVTPGTFAGLSLREIEQMMLPCGGRAVPLAELFFVERGPEGSLVIEIGDPRLDHVGAKMDGGELLVDGPVGAWAGHGMSGGTLRIAGGTGDFLGAELSGGRIKVAGRAGARLGAASSGSRRGMSGGVIRITGSAGPRAAERQRGGLIVIEGDAGEGLATEMIAGTVCVLGAIGPLMGRGMKRGTVLTRTVPELPAGFVDTGTQELIALQLMARRVPDLSGFLDKATRARRLVGDVLLGGQGEVLVPE
ncbi:formylmethanofuran dehydrogenase subunit C [Ancylobacter sp. A5.8]|uniref:formylmethanofuran dehydrogenase subunit C n=1 Tax=Ancylobacter gelatini TaxID=2919920 RepID=UPI001F4DBFAB|nr:formylmethanofuran dehydrogenase subunit C [Ancylobacter gelatini]MCJ8144278.1 formylmethanofuran dehydrogenase subunit C [Ancylobacter gelatini]